MAKSLKAFILKNNKGQSVVEYILLIAVISAIGFTFYNNRRFKEFLAGNDGFFASLRKGMAYSYRYGRPLSPSVDYDTAMGFEYQSNSHDTYLNKENGKSRFFTGTSPYGEQ